MSVGCEVKKIWLLDGRSQNRCAAGVFLSVGMRLAAQWSLCMLVCGLSVGAAAAAEGDPTAPPPEWLALQADSQGKRAPRAETVKEVQVVIIGRGKSLAVIDGKVVRVGDEYAGSKVTAVGAGGIINEDAANVLRVTPAVSKKMPAKSYPHKKDVLIVPIPDEVTKASEQKP